ncbi:MAG TPA: hypothetical protein VFG38_18050 [Pseudomonadales bacterium]|nr:hypothetical protein [Pseudomonadales bacterium]
MSTARAADAPPGPDAAMLDLANRVARFIASLDDTDIAGVFAERDVTIIENFAPYRFDGPAAVANWAAGMRAHRVDTANLVHAFGAPQDFSRTGDRVFFALPTTWKGTYRGTPFTETGGWAFVLVEHADANGNHGWRVQSYGWAVTAITTP